MARFLAQLLANVTTNQPFTYLRNLKHRGIVTRDLTRPVRDRRSMEAKAYVYEFMRSMTHYSEIHVQFKLQHFLQVMAVITPHDAASH